jgi:sugar O-acyltransferase (sialic acid O-acetyltransferase NeuD family)
VRALVIVGAGGHGRVCAEIAETTGIYSRICFSDSRFAKGSVSGRWTVEFHDDDLSSLSSNEYVFVIGVGQTGLGAMRSQIYEAIALSRLPAATIVCPDAHVAQDAVVGRGTLIGRMTIVNPGVAIGDNVIVNSKALVEHDVRVGSHVHISTGVILNGECVVGDRSMIGSGAILLQGIRVTDDVVVGAGAVVTRDIKEPGTYVGIPARRAYA